jgi:hypothetical protein
MTGLIVALAATLAALCSVVWTGSKGYRRAHFTSIGGMFALLLVAIWQAESVGRDLVFEGLAGTVHRVHMVAVVLTFLLVPGVAVTGLALARSSGTSHPPRRRRHRRWALAFVGLIVLTSALGTAMTWLAWPD